MGEVDVTIDSGVAVMTIDRPHPRNTIGPMLNRSYTMVVERGHSLNWKVCFSDLDIDFISRSG